MSSHTGSTYDAIAHRYAQSVDSRPWNAHFERPATVSLLPDLQDKRVLDAGCGPGWYAEYLVNGGAHVTAFDFNQDFVTYAKARLGDRARIRQADLSEPLEFAETGAFDLVVCPLVLHYLEDWLPTLREFHRVLNENGVLVFSTHHPASDWRLSTSKDYFALELLQDEWEGIGKVQFYRRPLMKICSDLRQAGFWIDHLVESQPTEKFREIDPATFERISKSPWFLHIRAMKN